MSLWTMRPFEAIASLSLLETVGYRRDQGRFCVCATCKMHTSYKGSYSVDKVMVACYTTVLSSEVTLNVLALENKSNDVVGLCHYVTTIMASLSIYLV